MQSSAQADASQQTMKRPTMQSWLCHSDFEPVPRIERPLTSQLQVRMTTAVATPGVLARKLNRWENHRTNADFDNSLVVKNFMFQFFNNYFKKS